MILKKISSKKIRSNSELGKNIDRSFPVRAVEALRSVLPDIGQRTLRVALAGAVEGLPCVGPRAVGVAPFRAVVFFLGLLF